MNSSPPNPAREAVATVPDRQAALLVAADRWSLWRTLARGLAHHLGNAAQMLAIEPLPPRARSEAAERLGLVQGRISETHRDGENGPTPVRDVMEDVQALQRLQSGFPSVELALEHSADLCAVGLSAPDLRHILLSLVTNAKHAASPGRAAIRISALQVAEGVELTVSDAGAGLAPGMHERAFEPFVTTREGGALGIGLTVARALARHAGGTLEADPGTSHFRLRLPAWRRPG